MSADETGLYYLQSRYYNPTWGRFINADALVSTGQGMLGNNMFAYCANNPVMGYDPTGYWDWGGVLTGIAILLGAAAYAYSFGCTSLESATTTVAMATTGTTMIYAAATDSVMVLDMSYSQQMSGDAYAKYGGAFVIDFEDNNVNYYSHAGGGKGYSQGLSYSVGLVDNYATPEDYQGHFVDTNVGCYIGIDHCWNPLDNHETATQATALTFSSGYSFGVGYDYYTSPLLVFKWEDIS